MRRCLLAACLGASLFPAGCAKPRAQVELPLPELVPPPPPPRIVAIYEEEAEEPPPPVEPEPVEESSPPPPKEVRPEARADVETAKTGPARSEPTRPRPPPSPSLTLKPAPGTEAKTEASIRALVGNTGRNLARINLDGLDSDGRTQYETARRFLQQAEEALKTGNLVFAGKLADKAATMATVLVR
ncbi:MAG: hypothetical protein LC791_03280 [Acidobacteria bacterium]|nr:hypothetical protein [Acidobacteriota bacterium]